MNTEILTYADRHFDGLNTLWAEAFPADPPRNAAARVVPSKSAMQPELLLVAMPLKLLDGVTARYIAGARD